MPDQGPGGALRERCLNTAPQFLADANPTPWENVPHKANMLQSPDTPTPGARRACDMRDRKDNFRVFA